jgi:8-oxo-dGTP pyrophosphatase MutT (NUDIX family)
MPPMKRELSAGGVVVRRMRGRWWMAAIEPTGRPGVRALPKGLIEEGEPTAVTAAREVLEETGLVAEPVARLGDVRYVYTLNGERIFKIVIFHLMRWRSGRLGNIAPEMRVEVSETEWIPLDEPQRLTHRSERGVAQTALDRVKQGL